MKKNHQKILILSITISAVTLIYLFRPSIWQERIETYLNNQLNDSGWILKNSVFSGHLFTQVSSNDIILTKPDGSIVQFPSIDARIKIVPLLLGRINLNQLTVSNATIKPSFDFQGDKTETSMIVYDPNIFTENIKN